MIKSDNISLLVMLAGWITDVYGSYDPTFILNGLIIMVSGLMLFAIPCLYRCDTYVTQPSRQHHVDSDDEEEEVIEDSDKIGPRVVIANGDGTFQPGEEESGSPLLVNGKSNGVHRNGLLGASPPLGELSRSVSNVVVMGGSESAV